MKIALVVHDFDPGLGQGRYAIELARRLGRRHQVEILANRFGVAPETSWKFVPIRAWRGNSLGTVFSFLLAAEREVRRRQVDLIHAQGLTCWSADVITAHVCNAARVLAQPPTTARGRLFPSLVIPMEARFYRQVRATHLIAISWAVAREVESHYGWRKEVSVIHHGVDTSEFRPPLDATERAAVRARYGLGPEDRVWLFVGEARKGLSNVIRQLPGFPGVRLLAISRSAAGEYRALAANLGVGDRLVFHGPETEIALAYRAADAFVYPSTYDTFGMVVAEAMASEAPVVVGKAVGAAEWLTDGVDGLLVDPAAPSSLELALRRIESDPEGARSLGARARRRALEYSWDHQAALTERVYEAALLRRRGGDSGNGARA
ncbi:MAG: glycosyltransferase family 4 protein [Verrucomicrobiales bacterium]|nr:glycosyltransferase family 4 protein [Verrucomicrobiales bacterium]